MAAEDGQTVKKQVVVHLTLAEYKVGNVLATKAIF